MEEISYANVMGCIMYAMVCTRPNIAYAVSVVSQFMANLGKAHWHALKWILWYLKGSLSIGLSYQCGAKMRDAITGFVDSDNAGSIDTRKSLSGYIFTIFGGLVSWKASLQKVVALSMIEAKFIAVIEVVKEALCL
ncbi:Retrovirus-related Pol polyprotein from transposon TNT 1-94 [Vitis vinifera]|uniref:Retrovirus-related Pol polyprotein from transposon TNT 1-94 n=1 Tax=Vitis vinifera TaxID=29760 RepID=A0A438GE82_VITVI|nr:Retrovirus-related Pol polyprotein from transposon TNT 1-94 [Vitis vinifera]